jgi:hypothetical protein
MKAVMVSLILVVVLVAWLEEEVEATGMLGDFGGSSAMQDYNSQMMDSPVMSFSGLLGPSLWPYIAYPTMPLVMTILSVQIQLPELNQPTARSSPTGRPKFWTDLCGVFVELKGSEAMHLMEEEKKPCFP